MTSIEYSPIKKIIVHEIIRNDFDDFLRMKAVPAGPNIPPLPVRWIDGILFQFAGYPQIPEIIHDNLEGTVHWNIGNFTEMKNYQKTVNHPDTGIALEVIDNSNNTAVSDFVRWLKKQPQWFGTATAA